SNGGVPAADAMATPAPSASDSNRGINPAGQHWRIDGPVNEACAGSRQRPDAGGGDPTPGGRIGSFCGLSPLSPTWPVGLGAGPFGQFAALAIARVFVVDPVVGVDALGRNAVALLEEFHQQQARLELFGRQRRPHIRRVSVEFDAN